MTDDAYHTRLLKRQDNLERAVAILGRLGFSDCKPQRGFLSEPDTVIVYHNGETRIYDVAGVLAYADDGKPLNYYSF